MSVFELRTYSREDQETWQHFFLACLDNWERFSQFIHPAFLENIEKLIPFKLKIPELHEINQILKPINWTAVYVDGFSPFWKIAQYLSHSILPISGKIRSKNEINFAHEPDLIHDLFGHLTILFDEQYRKMLNVWSIAASQVKPQELDYANYYLKKSCAVNINFLNNKNLSILNESIVKFDSFMTQCPTDAIIYEKIYFWIFEYGILRNQNKMNIYGSGILSSLSELKKIVEGQSIFYQLDENFLANTYHMSTEQSSYLVGANLEDSFRLLKKLIENIKVFRNKG